MMKKTVLFVCLLASFAANAQREKATAYINNYKDIAMSEMVRSGVPAAITLAQGILESKYGESNLCKESNNHFGIKCKPEWTGERVYHDDDAKHECFRSYATAEESFRDHSDFLKNRPYYTDLFLLDPADYEGWAKGLKKAGYATEKDYPQRLIELIETYDLNKYSLLALQQGKPAESKIVAVADKEEKIVITPAIKAEVLQPAEETKEDKKEVETPVAPQPAKEIEAPKEEKSIYPEGVFTINHSKVIYAKKGVSLLSLAGQYNITLSKLFDFNDMTETDILGASKLMFIERKLKKGASDFHVVATGETLYDISQQEGVRLENILAYNGLQKTATPTLGQKIYLRVPAPVISKSVPVSANKSVTSSR